MKTMCQFAFVGFEHSVCRGLLMTTYDHLYTYIPVYISFSLHQQAQALKSLPLLPPMGRESVLFAVCITSSSDYRKYSYHSFC